MKRLGLTVQELKFISLKQLKKRSDSAGTPIEILRMRWNHMEEKRTEKIILTRNERQNVIMDEAQGNIVFDEEEGCFRLPNYTQLKSRVKQERMKSAKSKKNLTLDGDSEMIRKEIQNLEKIKKKQEKEFEQKMLYEQQMAEIQAKNDEK